MLTTCKALLVTASMGMALVTTAHAATVSYTYTYDQATIDHVAVGANDKTNRVVLNDGIIPVSDLPWDTPGNANFSVAGGAHPHPGLTLDLGGEFDLDSLTIYYGVRQTSGVHAPDTLDILVDGDAVPQFTGFDQTQWTAGNVNRFVTVNLTGYTGSTIHLDFRNSEGFINLQEIVVSAIPEPASLALIGLGGMLILKRRSR